MNLSHMLKTYSPRFFLQEKKKFFELFFVIFYLVGIVGTAAPFSRELFLNLFPLAQILSFSVILIFHRETFDRKTIVVLMMIAIMGFLIEVAGVNTGFIFGIYEYGNSLGVKMLNTPWLIGLNWVMLSYAGSSLTEGIPIPVSLKIIIASLIMVLYDIILEQAAPLLDMWYWYNNEIPLQNYIAWFLTALVFQSFIKVAGVKTHNTIVHTVILMQVVFLLSLVVFTKFLK
jgi:bisanhydrobacterioruberin hydratase